MPYKKITDLDALTAITDDDLLVVVNSPGSGPGTRKITWAQVMAYITSGAAGITITVSNAGLHILDTNASHDLIVKPGSDLSADRTLTVTTGDADRTLALSGNLTVESASIVNQDLTSDATPTFAGVTVGNTGLHILDTNSSHDLIVKPGSDLTADRTLTVTTGDADRTLSLGGTMTIEADSVVNQDLSTDATGVRFASLGLGVAATSPLHISKTYTGGAAAAEYGANVTALWSGADTGVKAGLYFYASAAHTSGTLASLYGMYGYAVAAGSGGTTTTLVGILAQTYIGAGTTVGNAYGVYIGTGVQSGTLTSKYGIYVEANTASFATNKYGLYVGAQSGAASANWSIYIAGGLSYFGDNVGIGQASFGTAATKTLAVGTGTAPASSPADAFQMYSADQAAGNACPHFRTENGAIVKVYQQAAIADTSGALLADVEAEVNKLKAALRNLGLIAT